MFKAEDIELLKISSKNTPTNPGLWRKILNLTKGKQKSIVHNKKRIMGPNNGKGFKKYPSAYANGWAAKLYKRLGGGWKKKAMEKSAAKKSKKNVGHGGLDEWFSGHGGGKKKKNTARRGDWVAISPVTKTLSSGRKVKPGDIVGPCGISSSKDWKKETKDGDDPLKCMPRQKAHDMPKKERAEIAKGKRRAEKKDKKKSKKPTRTRTFGKKKSKKKKSSENIAMSKRASEIEAIYKTIL